MRSAWILSTPFFLAGKQVLDEKVGTNSDTGFGTWPGRGPSPLECIFSMGDLELPEGPEPPHKSYMPRDCDWMLDGFLMRGIVDESSEAWWRKCILKQAHLDW